MTERSPAQKSASRRLAGLAGLAVRRVWTKALYTDTRRVGVSVGGVALAVALTIVVTGVAVGLSSQGTVGSDDVDYWIVPEEGTASTMVVSTGGPQFGRVHETTDRLTADPDVSYATPVLVELVQLSNGRGSDEYVLLIGVVAQPGISIAGLPTDRLDQGDPYFANGTYDGPWTGQAVVSSATAALLHVSVGDEIAVSDTRENASFTAVGVEEGGTDTGFGQVPTAVVHLSELQALTGADGGDQADQLLVDTNVPGVKPALEAVYPHSSVIARGGLTTSVPSSGLSLAMSLTAGTVGLVVGTLFVATTMGLEVTADRRIYGVLGAIGLSRRSRGVIVLVQTLLVTAVGGVLGVCLGWLGVGATNAIAMATVTTTPVASFHPLLPIYGVAIALGIGVLSVPYLLWLTGRSSVLDQLTR